MALTKPRMVVFDNVPCPSGGACTVDKCLFSHALHPKHSQGQVEALVTPNESAVSQIGEVVTSDRPRSPKRRKVNDQAAPGITDAHSRTIEQTTIADDVSSSTTEWRKTSAGHTKSLTKATVAHKPVSTLHKPISPPKLKGLPSAKKVGSQTTVDSQPRNLSKSANPPNETLHPRKVDNDPAPWARRKLYLDILHVEMKRCNKLVQGSSLTKKSVLQLSDGELIKACLDVEEPIASKNTAVYDSVMKQQVMKFKKMTLTVWVEYVKTTFDILSPPVAPAVAPCQRISIKHGLPISAEHLLLAGLKVKDQSSLAQYGYVASPPKEDEIAEAEATKALTPGWEVCQRCKTRFQCFPERRADGVITTNGPCVFHWGNKLYTGQSRASATMHGPRDMTYQCCEDSLDSPGCTRLETHVFKVAEAPLLASTLQFITTPENTTPRKSKSGQTVKALTFDCEMGYTSFGFEMIRVTAISWPDNEPLLDVLVRPQGAILDLNTRFSGVAQEAFASAVPYSQETATDNHDRSNTMRIVSGPAAARDLLCSFLTPKTPVIGHALENDLNVIRLCHGVIVDTVMIFPHPRGLPYRLSLRHLSERYLRRDIQTGGANGHDSKEDAIATGDLVRYAVADRWRRTKAEGWTIKSGELIAPTRVGMSGS